MKKLFLIPALIFALSGCATLNNATGAAALGIKTLAETTREECGAKSPAPCLPESAISTKERDEIKKTLTEAQMYLEDANRVRKGGTGHACLDFHSCLSVTHSLLSTVEGILNERD